VVLAQLRALATRGDPKNWHDANLRLVKNLYDRNWSAADVRQLFRVIDWLMDLPPELQQGFRKEIHEFEEDRRMPYVRSLERLAREEGPGEGAREELLATIWTTFEDKFGSPEPDVNCKIQAIQNLPQLRRVMKELVRANALSTFRTFLESTSVE
jgi:hypothetical protein